MTVGCVVCNDLDMVWDMSLGEAMQRSKSGRPACCQQLVHKDWDSSAQTPLTEIVQGLLRIHLT